MSILFFKNGEVDLIPVHPKYSLWDADQYETGAIWTCSIGTDAEHLPRLGVYLKRVVDVSLLWAYVLSGKREESHPHIRNTLYQGVRFSQLS